MKSTRTTSALRYQYLLATVLIAALLASPVDIKASETQVDFAEDQALIQIMIHGLSVFDFSKPDQLTVYFPKADGHIMAIDEGRMDGNGLSWHNLVPDFSGRRIELSLGNDIGKLPSSDPPEKRIPASKRDARDARWILRASEFEENPTFVRENADATLFTQGGTLETCSLIIDPDFRDACRVRNLMLEQRFYRVGSESMVIRHSIFVDGKGNADGPIFRLSDQHDTGGFRDITPFYEIERITLSDCSEDQLQFCARWGTKFFRYVYDLRVRNTPPPTFERPAPGERQMRSFHGHHVKALFFDSIRNWDVISPDCRQAGGDWICENCVDRQPLCWDYFSQYSESDSTGSVPSYEDASACPLVGYP